MGHEETPPSRGLTGFPWPWAIVSALLFGAMAIQASPLRPPVVALQFVYTRRCFSDVLTAWGEGRERFFTHFAFDFPFLLSYGVFGYLLATRTLLAASLPTALRPAFRWLLPVAAAADALENLLEIHLAGHLATAPDCLFLAAGLVSAGKWLLIAAFAAAGAIGFRRLGHR